MNEKDRKQRGTKEGLLMYQYVSVPHAWTIVHFCLPTGFLWLLYICNTGTIIPRPEIRVLDSELTQSKLRSMQLHLWSSDILILFHSTPHEGKAAKGQEE